MASIKYAEDFLRFVNASPSPFHAVHSAIQLLEKAGFEQLKEQQSWGDSVKQGGKYFITRNASSIIAFAVGNKWKPGSPIGMIGAHTDSPCLRVKPTSKKQSDGFLQVGVETYGGGLWHTWFDRDLSIAGRAMVKGQSGGFQQKLVKISKAILRIPTLAVHLDRQENFSFNKESQLFPIAGLAAAELNRRGEDKDYEKLEKGDSDSSQPFEPLKAPTERHHPYLVELIAKEAGVAAADVVDFEMVLYDTQQACIGGLNDELIFSARLDNLMMSFCSVQGLIESLSTPLDEESTVRLISLFDHEEIGSTSAQGAESTFLPAVISRLTRLPFSGEVGSSAHEETLSKSFLISADMAHSVNPNYPAKYETDHRPEMNKGTTIKVNANVRYATNSPGIVLLQEVARRAKKSSSSTSTSANGVPLQLFVARNDTSCGSTIGPMLSAALGARTLDLGNAQLSMHSIRETCGSHDVEHAVRLFESFFAHFGEVGQSIEVD